MLTAKDIPGENNFMSERDGGMPEEVCERTIIIVYMLAN